MIEALSRHMIASFYSMEKMRLSCKMIMQFIIDHTYFSHYIRKKTIQKHIHHNNNNNNNNNNIQYLYSAL